MDENQNYGEANNHGVRSVFRIESGRVGFGKDGRDMLEYFKNKQAENPGFFYAVQLDDDNRLSNVFWADARSRVAYTHFGDVVMLETSYVVKRYRALFTGVNHHGEPILLGCGLLVDDSESSFVWLLRTFLTAMGGCSPISFVTDGNRGLVASVSQVFPMARHCVNKWHVLREGQDKLTRACLADLYDCINLTETIEEFETSWASIIRKYDLSENDWVQSIYEVRRQWVPVYFRDSFFAACFLKQDTECSIFVGQVNEQTTLPVFFRQFERAMDYWFEKEIEADLEAVSNKPDLKTPSPMEKQVADLYTRKVFAKFQEELVETFVYTANRIGGDEDKCTYQIVKFDDERRKYTVTLDMPNLRASCSCLMFEYTGVLCRHILTVFAVTNVLTLPSHFILNRWTVNAKSVTKSNELGVNHAHESMSSRYNALCREAIRYAQEGALTSETYDTAVTALQEARRTIDLVMKNAAKFAPQTPRVGIGYSDKRFFGAKTPLLWPPQDEAAHQFNLNDSTMNLIRVAPVSYCDDGSPDNMVVLPCLKSMTWVMELNNAVPANKIAVISLKLQDNWKSHKIESEVKFQLTRITLEPMLRSMAYIREQLSAPANKVAIINLKLQDSETITGESEVKFQVSRDTLGAMLRSMTYIREQLSISVDQQVAPLSKKQRK